MRSNGRILPAAAVVAGAAALAGVFAGTAQAATYESGHQLQRQAVPGDGPELAGDQAGFAAARQRSGLPFFGSDDDDSDDEDFRDDRARDRYSNSGDCYYEYDHTDDGYRFEFCDIHGDDEDFDYYDGYDGDHRDR